MFVAAASTDHSLAFAEGGVSLPPTPAADVIIELKGVCSSSQPCLSRSTQQASPLGISLETPLSDRATCILACPTTNVFSVWSS